MMRNASAVAQLEIASRASMSPLVIQEATCDDGVIVYVQGVDAGTYLLLRVQSGSIVVSLSPAGTFIVGAALQTIDRAVWCFHTVVVSAMINDPTATALTVVQ
jgi:hypothetical protein